jgi:hypothetical protein
MRAPDDQFGFAALSSGGAGLRGTLEKPFGRQTDLRVFEEIRGQNSLGCSRCHRRWVSGAGSAWRSNTQIAGTSRNPYPRLLETNFPAAG